MATKRPRTSVTFTPETYELLRELAEMNGQSLSSLASEMLDLLVPQVRGVVEAGRRYQALSESMREQIRREFEEAEERVVPAAEALQREIFGMLEGIGQEPEQDPRAVTRGSRPPSSTLPLRASTADEPSETAGQDDGGTPSATRPSAL